MRASFIAAGPLLTRRASPTFRLSTHSPPAPRWSASRFTMSNGTAAAKRIATHNGTFHCDEALAVHMLRHTGTYRGAAVVRSRDPAVLAEADVVVDVGGTYDAGQGRFDHHQRGFAHTFEKEGVRARTKLSSAGLVYKHFGREVVRNVLAAGGITLEEKMYETVFLKVYESFVEAVDAVDNGIAKFDSTGPPKYASSTDLGARVGRLNAEWNEPNSLEIQDANFQKAVALAGGEFDDCILHIAKSWIPAQVIVATAMAARFDEDAAGRLLVLREWAPWKGHVYEIEEQEAAAAGGMARPVKYVVYKDMTGSSWRVQAVAVDKTSFESRTPLPGAWRGYRDDELSKVADVEDCVFVHASGFIGGNKTFDGAMQMAKKSLAMAAAEAPATV